MELLVRREDVIADSKDNDDRTPLFWAAVNGHLAVVNLLVGRSDVKANSKTDFGVTPLCAAVELGRLEVVRLLLEQADVNLDLKGQIDHLLFLAEIHEEVNAPLQNLIEHLETEDLKIEDWKRGN